MGIWKGKTNKNFSTLESTFRWHLEGDRQEIRKNNIILYWDKHYENNTSSCCDSGWELSGWSGKASLTGWPLS